ncbi:hypothetical protein ABZP36_005612 [Zizania latifolia]
MAPGLQRLTDIAGDGGPRLDGASGEELVRVERAASVALGRRAPEPPGTLFVTTRRVIFLREAEKGQGYAVDFLAITLHAVSRDPEAYPSPGIYTQAEAGFDEEAGESYCQANGELQLAKVSEMGIILSDPGQLDELFGVSCHCAELNPDNSAARGLNPSRCRRRPEQPSETLSGDRKSSMAAAAVYGGMKGRKLGVEEAHDLQLNRIRITLSSKNVKNLE